MDEYVRLFERFQRLRPDDAPDDIDRLIALVENGTLKERGGNFVVTPREGEFEELDWEPGSHNTARIPISEFTDGYFSVPQQRGALGAVVEGFMIEEDIPRGLSLSGPPVSWIGQVHNVDGTFRFKSPVPDD